MVYIKLCVQLDDVKCMTERNLHKHSRFFDLLICMHVFLIYSQCVQCDLLLVMCSAAIVLVCHILCFTCCHIGE